MWLIIIFLILLHTFLLSVTPSMSPGKLLKRWQMASWVTFADIQGSAFISVLQFTLVNEIHLCRWDGLVASLSLSLFLTFSLSPSLPPSIHVPKWMPSVRGNGKVAHGFAAALKCHAEEKIFNGLSVAFPALTCQVIRNLSLTLSVFFPHPPFSRSSAPQGHDTSLITCYTNRRKGWHERGRLLLKDGGVYLILLLITFIQAGCIFLAWLWLFIFISFLAKA